MMYRGIMFVGYLCACFASIVAIVLIILIFLKGREYQTKHFSSFRLFSMNVMLFTLLYFSFFCSENMFDNYEVALPLRILDYIFSGMLIWTWLLVVDGCDEGGHQVLRRFAAAIGIARITAGVIVTSFFMNAYYIIGDNRVMRAYSVYEAVMTATEAILLVVVSIKFLNSSHNMFRKRYILAVSTLLLIREVDTYLVDFGLYAGNYGISAWGLGLFDPNCFISLLITVYTVYFLFKEDFSPLYFAEGSTEPVSISKIAEEYRLTVREFEVYELILEGKNNPEIAEELFISINTVKKHAKSIYDKAKVSGRIELIQLINRKSTR